MPRKPQKVRLSRQSAKAQRRQRVIDAVFDCISRKGIVDTTVADIASAAGVANGTVIQHFTSKQALMTEALKQLTREFDTISESAEQIPTDDPAARLRAVVLAHLHPALCRRERLATWFAFWGEASARPIYRRLCRARDKAYYQRMEALVRELAWAGGYAELDVHAATHLLVAACEGIWLAMLTGYIRQWDGEAALRQQLAALFPRNFGPRDLTNQAID
ncbi:MAG TPA: TetR/AcrR family transcriptional regulator [Verrucomicrobiae bacterium]|nr:TetR/AcrR family transcriptional regulator [Verrucomicrobiae bacterium]